VNGQRQGLVLEKPFRMGDTIAKELASSEHSSSSSSSSSTVLDIEAEIKLAFDYSRRRSVDSASFAQEMKDLGLERYYSARNASVFLFFLSFSRFY
jgi:fatty acyl-CoA reductase